MKTLGKRALAIVMTAVLILAGMSWPGTADTVKAAGTIQDPAEHYKKVSRNRVSVHDPSIIKDPKTGRYYIFGSHLAWAYSDDLETWKTFTNNISTDYRTLFKKEFEWAAAGDPVYDPGGNMWAPDVIWNKKMNKWCMYMSINGCSWNSVICLLTADRLDGNWTYVGPVIYSGFTADGTHDYKKTNYQDVTGDTSLPDRFIRSAYTTSDNGTACEATTWNRGYGAHAIDAGVFYDESGKLWFCYGSWSGGIYIFELDESTGFRNKSVTYPYENGVTDPYMGRKLGGSGASGEASYIEYINGYYYLFISYGGLVANGGYNMRVFRSKNPDGPYTDVSGNNATEGGDEYGSSGRVGTRLMGYYKWSYWDYAHVAQGHNSALLDDDGKAYVFYHTRTNDGTEGHTVRVHQLFTTKDGYLTAAPFEYSKTDQVKNTYSKEEIAGKYEILFQNNTNHKTLEYNEPKQIELKNDGTVAGDVTGTWTEENGSANVEFVLGGITYQGTFVEQTMEETNVKTLCFTVVGANGQVDTCLWGYKYPSAKAAVSMASENLSLPKRVSDDIELPKTGLYGTTIQWSSDSPFLLDDGTVIQPKADAAAKLTATISLGGESYEKEIEVTIAADIEGPSKVASYYTDKALDLSAGTTVSVENPLKGADISNGVSFKLKVKRTGVFGFLENGNIFSFIKGAEKFYFNGGAYLGYNGNGGYVDANMYNGNYATPWRAGTDFIGENKEVQAEIKLTASGFSVLIDGNEAYTNKTVDNRNKTGMDDNIGSGKVPGGYSLTDYSKVLDMLSTADSLNFGTGSFWAGTFKGTLRDFEIWVEPVEQKPASGNTYYSEDYEGNTDVTKLWTGAITATKVAGDTNYVNIVPSGSGNRGTEMSFGLSVQPEGEYTFETDAMLTVSKGGNGSTVPATQFVLTGKDLVHAANDKATAGYILKLSAEGTNNQSFTINDTSDSVAIPDSGWVHIVVDMNSADRTKATLTITDKSTGKALVSDKEITVNGTGELSGIYLMLGRGTSSCIKLDNTLVKKPGIADYAQLNTVLARAKKYVRQHTASPVYSEASMAALNQAIQAAEALSPSLTDDQQEQVDACAEALKTAIAGLTCKEHSYNHNKGTVLEQATCTKEGREEVTCYYCGARTEAVLAKKDHEYGEWKLTKAATDTEAGERERSCKNCTDKQTESVPLCEDHSYGSPTVTKPATCTEKGLQREVCDVCGYVHESEIPLKDHEAGEWIFVKAATPETKGERIKKCVNCDTELQREEIEFCKEHQFDEGVVGKEPTCTEKGERTCTCKVCGFSETKEIPVKNHVAGPWEITKKATTASEGERAKKCTQCGIVLQTEKIAKLQTNGNPGGSGDNIEPVRTDVVYKVGSLKYKVTDVKKKTVTVTGPKKKSAKTVTIGKTVKIRGISFKITQIGNNAFSKCKKLKNVTIGANVTKIGKKAFYKDTKLKSIVVKTKKLKSVGSQAFKGIYKKAKIKVPSSRLKKYKKLFKKKGQARTVKIKK